MSEVIRHGQENKAEAPLNNAEAERRAHENAERLRAEAEQAEASRDPIEKIQERLERATQNQEKIQINNAETRPSEASMPVGAHMRASAVNTTLKRVRKQMNAPERAGSRFIHQPVVDAVSTA